MRFVVLALALIAARPQPVTPVSAPRPVVVLVHGRGQLGADSAALRAEWKRDLDASLTALGMPVLSDDDVWLAWYADVLDPAVDGACAGSGSHAGPATFARGFLASLASVVPDSGTADRDVRSLLGDVMFLVDPLTRCAAETRLNDVLVRARAHGRPVIMIAYSLGSVVAYQHLSRLSAGGAASLHLITVGSPLGVPAMRELLLGNMQELRRPPAVASWVNIYDPEDAFAAAVGIAAVEDRMARTLPGGRGDAPPASRYFRDERTGMALAQRLCDGRDAEVERCASLRRD
jgi:hypothetical protein